MRRLCADAEALCRTLAPDAAPGPLYVVLRPDLATEYQGGEGGPLAVTSRHMELTLRPTLERHRRWRGHGPAMLLDPVAIAAYSAARPRAARRRAFPAVVTGVVLHELAHIINAGPRDEAEPDPGLVRFGRLVLAADLTGRELPTNGPGAVIPSGGHEWPFIRVALHLAHRARHAGVDLMPIDVFDALHYGLSATARYAQALGAEPGRLVGADFATIVATEPPAAFTALWQADIARWNDAHSTNTDAHQTLAAGEHRP